MGEQNTKAALIVPVLRALEWDVEDPDEVTLEYRRRGADKPVDYALSLQRKPTLFVEAKALDENLDDRRWANQIVSYAAVAGVEWVVLTNGDEYRMYNAHAPVPVEEKLFRAVQVSESVDEAEEALGFLSKPRMLENSLTALWRAYSVDHRVKAAIDNLFAPEPSSWLVRRLAKQLDGLTPTDVRAALSRARISLDFPREDPRVAGAKGHVGVRRSSQPRAGRIKGEHYGVSVGQLIEAGLIRPPLQIEQRYMGQTVTGQIESDGRVSFGGQTYKSLSVAAAMARVSVKGAPPPPRKYWQTNGWTFWHYRDETGELRELAYLRDAYLASVGQSGA
jgi:Restriction Enzyme Adenine Methylase Associated/Type I restriction enzyme R protein N terminus (HSDR_N)